MNNNFAAYKCSTDGLQNHWGIVRGLTMKEASDPAKYPLGKQKDSHGEYVWMVGLTEAMGGNRI